MVASDKLLHTSCKVSPPLSVCPSSSIGFIYIRPAGVSSRLPRHPSRLSPAGVRLHVCDGGHVKCAPASLFVLASTCFNNSALWQCFIVLCLEREENKVEEKFTNAVEMLFLVVLVVFFLPCGGVSGIMVTYSWAFAIWRWADAIKAATVTFVFPPAIPSLRFVLVFFVNAKALFTHVWSPVDWERLNLICIKIVYFFFFLRSRFKEVIIRGCPQLLPSKEEAYYVNSFHC